MKIVLNHESIKIILRKDYDDIEHTTLNYSQNEVSDVFQNHFLA